MNAIDIILNNGKPGERYATNKEQNVIAVWEGERWRVLHAITIMGTWGNTDNVNVNGVPAWAQEDFVEVLRPDAREKANA